MMKLKVLTAAIALGFAAGGASATTILFDADGSGAGANYNAGALNFSGPDSNPVVVEKFNLTSVPGTYNIIQSLGADGILGNGDTFRESFTLNLTTTQNFAGTPTGGYSVGLAGTHVWMEVNLAGYIANYASATPTTAATPTSFYDDSFSIVVDPMAAYNGVKMYYDADGDRTGSVLIADWKVLGGGGDKPATNNSTATFDFGVDLQFISMPVAGVWLSTAGDELSLMLPLVFGLADGSANLPQGVPTAGGAGVCFDGNDCLVLPVSDNQITARVAIPEPGSMALVGLGLLGAAMVRRRKAQK